MSSSMLHHRLGPGAMYPRSGCAQWALNRCVEGAGRWAARVNVRLYPVHSALHGHHMLPKRTQLLPTWASRAKARRVDWARDAD